MGIHGKICMRLQGSERAIATLNLTHAELLLLPVDEGLCHPGHFADFATLPWPLLLFNFPLDFPFAFGIKDWAGPFSLYLHCI